jgi:phosphatidate cytidylyltransferase
MKRVLTAAVLIPVVLLIVFKAPLWLFALVVAAIIVLALHEYLGMVEAAGIKPFRRQTYAISLVPILLFLYLYLQFRNTDSELRMFWVYPADAALLQNWWIFVGLAPLVFGVLLVFRKDLRSGLASVAVSAFGMLYIGFPLALFIAMRADDFYCILILFVLFSVWAGDIAAYYVGRSIGRHKLAPIVSPNKSWEGAIASVIASVLIAVLVFDLHTYLDPLFTPMQSGDLRFARSAVSHFHAGMLGALTNIAAQFGDLFESALKRSAGVKDSGTLLPGHGGMLDRIDALLFAVPVVWYYANLTGFLIKPNP